MKVSIIVFSPSGHTLKVAHMIQKAFEERNNLVKLINITGKTEFLYGNDVEAHLERELGEYDVLFVGGPIYAGHIESNVIKIMKALPFPDEKHSRLVVPFVSYGGVHSSIALEEMGEYLKNQNRKSILGIKIAAKHTLTPTLSKVIYPDKPGLEEENIVIQAVDRVIAIVEKGEKSAEDQSESFKYAPQEEREIFHKYSQEMLHKDHKDVSINIEKCIACKKCIMTCPVDMFEFSEEKVIIHRDKSNCILCAECFHNCPAGAIIHPYIEMAKKRLKDGFAKLEEVASAIYPEI